MIAALPPSLQERCIAAPGLLAQIIVSKYCDHLPLYRQEAILGNRHGVHLPRQSMARWMELAADWLRPIYEQIPTGVMAGGYLQIDETPIRYLAPGHGQTKLGYFWTALSPGGDVVYHWETSRGADCLKNVIAANFPTTGMCWSAMPKRARSRPSRSLGSAGSRRREAPSPAPPTSTP
ncbi:MAG: transposase, partial [Terrimicrobiaceae bacterium]